MLIYGSDEFKKTLAAEELKIGARIRDSAQDSMLSWIRNSFIELFVEEKAGVDLLSREIAAKPKLDYKKYLKSAKWKEIREKVPIRHNDACGRCGGLADEVHHKML